jgi:hypothetical protein
MNERERKVLSQVCKEVLKIDAHIGFASVVDGTGKLLSSPMPHFHTALFYSTIDLSRLHL